MPALPRKPAAQGAGDGTLTRPHRENSVAGPAARAEDAPTSHLARGARILRFLTRYWRAGVFDVDNAARRRVDPQLARTFAADLEALGPAFIKVGQALST
ncbi:MAG TPA: hypothetical protein VHF86_01145, partial [Xanthomonadaceae bacterium]|nr:hypothetical protein [Xanthomonadaceae bacterium]